MSMQVIITDHARERFWQYEGFCPPKRIRRIVHWHLKEQLSKGAKVISGAIQLQVKGKLWAVVEPDVGGWIVKTFHRGKKMGGLVS
jgi:hypothetical protein